MRCGGDATDQKNHGYGGVRNPQPQISSDVVSCRLPSSAQPNMIVTQMQYSLREGGVRLVYCVCTMPYFFVFVLCFKATNLAVLYQFLSLMNVSDSASLHTRYQRSPCSASEARVRRCFHANRPQSLNLQQLGGAITLMELV